MVQNPDKNTEQDDEKDIVGYPKAINTSVSTIHWTSSARKAGEFRDDEGILSEPKVESDSPLVVEEIALQNLVAVEKEDTSTIRSISIESLPVRRTGTGLKHTSMKLPTDDSSIAFDYNPAVVAYVSSGRTHQLKTLKRRQVSLTSILFENYPLAPVTIIFTTPENKSPSSSGTPATTDPSNIIRSRGTDVNISTTPGPMQHTRSMSPDSLFTPDHNRLMPLTQRQIDHRRLQKAREFRETRKFLIDFMNAKADQFPKKLRRRMMNLYSINELDLEPATVAGFEFEMSDEGVVLAGLSAVEEGRDADDLRILVMALRSQIAMVPPTKEQVVRDPMPPSGKTTARRRSTSIAQKPEAQGEERQEADEETRSPACKGTLVPHAQPSTTAQSAEPSTPPTEPTILKHELRRSCSEPNLKRTVNSMAMAPVDVVLDLPTTPNLARVNKARGNSLLLSGGRIPYLQHLQQESTSKIIGPPPPPPRSKRRNVFESVRDAIGGKVAATRKRSILERDLLV